MTARRAGAVLRRAPAARPAVRDPVAHHMLMLEQVFERADAVRRHPLPHRLSPLPVCRGIAPSHRDHAARPAGPAGSAAAVPGVRRHAAGVDLRRAARAAARANWHGTVYHGLPRDLLPLHAARARRLPRVPRAHLAREARRPRDRDRARASACRSRSRPRSTASTRTTSRRQIKPLLDQPGDRVHRRDRRAPRRTTSSATRAALLFPIDWPEPFGLVMIEAMACGTPVIACRCGSVPEVIDDGVTGFVVDSDGRGRVPDRRRAVALDRGRCRAVSRSASRPSAWPPTTCRSTRACCWREERRHARSVPAARRQRGCAGTTGKSPGSGRALPDRAPGEHGAGAMIP